MGNIKFGSWMFYGMRRDLLLNNNFPSRITIAGKPYAHIAWRFYIWDIYVPVDKKKIVPNRRMNELKMVKEMFK